MPVPDFQTLDGVGRSILGHKIRLSREGARDVRLLDSKPSQALSLESPGLIQTRPAATTASTLIKG